MKANIAITHVAAIPGYEKIHLHFHSPKTGLERLIVAALDFNKPQYIAGKEPKYSLYVGQPEPIFIEGAVARQWTPSYKKFSWERFWKELRAQNPAYKFSCRCGCWFKSESGPKGSYRQHKKNCLTMREFKIFLERLETSQLYQEALNAERQSKRKKKVAKTSSKRRVKRRKAAVEAPKKKVAKRRVSKH